ncbi:C4-dicarboxylate TRAP transporter large permease protein DctM [bacterium HR39]|nr:C4-dicarboxylate TRAP transporter large permease protein DctM [bacterium HR39]
MAELPPLWRRAVAASGAAGILLAVYQLFNLGFFGVLLDNRYLYLLAALFLPVVFLCWPARRGRPRDRVRSLDLALAALAFACCLFFALTAERSLLEGWEYMAPPAARAAALVLWALILEATRRVGGPVVFAVALVLSLYPTFADLVPGPISAFSQPFLDVVAFHVLSGESSFGIPMRAFGELVIGFLVFGAVLQHGGGGRFFNDLAFALVGRFRGGPAKVAVIASGLMGSVSGSVVSNVLSTGAVPIPAMKRSGLPPHVAAATEACASTGGVLMPPVMGTTAFVMASFLSIPYASIALAAAIPSLLYYAALFLQLDAYAARRGLAGLPPAELPSLRATLREGWPFLLAFALLIWLLLGTRQETLAPFYATAALLVIGQLRRATRLDLAGFVELLHRTARALAELVALLLGVGLILGAFAMTGLAGTLVNDLLHLAGGSVPLLLVMGALTSFVFGMGMTVTAVYIFLAVVLAPALVRQGLDPLAVHLFVMYWGMVSYITPPVALGAFAAATLAGAPAMRVGLTAVRLGSVIYVVPFLFVLDPVLIGRGEPVEILLHTGRALAGVWLVAGALQGFLPLGGDLGTGPGAAVLRGLLLAAGLCFAAPPGAVPVLGGEGLTLAGLLLAGPVIVHLRRRAQGVPAVADRTRDRTA